MREIGADAVHAAPTHRIKVIINVEINANHANAGTWHVRSRSPGNSRRTAHTNETCWVVLWRWRAHRPLAESKWNHTDPQPQDKRSSNKVRWRFHLRCAGVSKTLFTRSGSKMSRLLLLTHTATE